MKLIVCTAAAIFVMAGAAVAADMTTTQKQLVDMEAGWSNAIVHKDAQTISGIVADDWLGQDQTGKSQGKAAMLAQVKSGELGITGMTNRDVNARVMGNFAVVQGADDQKSMVKGKDTSGSDTWMDVFENRDGKWVAIASQNTPVKPSK